MARLKTVERNGARLAMMLHSFTEERRRCFLVAGPAQIKVDGLAFGVRRAVQPPENYLAVPEIVPVVGRLAVMQRGSVR